MTYPNLKELTTADLQVWYDTVGSFRIVKYTGAFDIFDWCKNVDEQNTYDLGELYEALGNEIDRRNDLKIKELAARIEATPIPEPTSPEFEKRMLLAAACRLMRLVELNAPNVIIANEINTINRRRPE